ncbi:MAG: hypothetical protein J0H43_03825, partial [Actinobacteria bacterium]|nr:hypothetical protein [Actinomycetota bacterium]
MTDGTTTTRPLRPLERRLRAAAPLLLQGRTIASEPATLLDLTVASVRASGRLDLVWLLLVTVTGSFPTSVEVQAARRRLELDDTIDSTIWLLGE